MSGHISNQELAVVRPTVLGGMLEALGWHETVIKPQLFRVLESPDGVIDILIPLNRQIRDYPARLNQALNQVEDYLGDRARQFMLQLLVGPVDEFLFIDEAVTVHGSIPWAIGEDLHETARGAFRAAAKSSQEHLPYFSQRGHGHARRFMERIRMGQTGQGSYIVTALVPLVEEEELEPETLPGFESLTGLEADNFYRAVTINLMQASGVAVQAAEEFNSTDSFEPFLEAVDYGVSAELVEALSKMSYSQEAEIRANWSPLVGEPENIPSIVEFTPNHAIAFKMVAEHFKDSRTVKTVTVTGQVTGLDRPRFGQSGVSKLEVVSGIEARRLRVRLSPGQYQEAIDAHSAGNLLEVTGEYSREGNFSWLYNVRDIRVVLGELNLFGDIASEQGDDSSSL